MAKASDVGIDDYSLLAFRILDCEIFQVQNDSRNDLLAEFIRRYVLA